MYGLAVMLSIPKLTSSKNIDEMYIKDSNFGGPTLKSDMYHKCTVPKELDSKYVAFFRAYLEINLTDYFFCFLQGLGKKCPYYLDPSTNDMTGRVIDDQPTIDYILKLHNEVRSKIGRGRCDQPKAGCMWPLVNF